MRVLAAFVLLGLAMSVAGTTYFKEDFSGDWESRWVQSSAKSDYGKMKVTAGKFYADAEESKGLQTSQDAKNYATSAKFPAGFSNEGKTLVVQYECKHEQIIDCGGGYLKILPSTLDQAKFTGDSEYAIMFGPDMCGSTRKVHLIFNYKGKNLLWKKEPSFENDGRTHVYTLVLNSDNTYEMQIDGDKKESGSLEADWDFLPAKEIDDPSDKKPSDWVDEPEMDDPEDKKPEDWGKEPETIADPDAKQPDDWDEEEDGKWEAPMIPNPAYKGEWKAKRIANPAYKGVWKPKQIANPEYVADDKLYLHKDLGAAGFDLWQVKSGTIFDNIIVTDSVDEAKVLLDKYKSNKDKEKKMKDEQDEAERKKAEAEKPPAEEDEGGDDGEEEEAEGAHDEL